MDSFKIWKQEKHDLDNARKNGQLFLNLIITTFEKCWDIVSSCQ